MAAFEDEQIEQFIKNWFQKSRDLEVGTAERCWELLNSKDYRAAKELAQTPLLLTLLCVVYDEFQDFPKKRHALYGEALDVLLRKWASEKRIQRNPIYQELSAELELDMLAEIARPVPVCADESCFDRASLAGLRGKYDAVNLKLDKTGGLTEGLLTRDLARAMGFRVMVGCMVGSSLAMAPAVILAQGADWTDLDGPLLLAEDRPNPLHYDAKGVHPPDANLWG